MSESEESPGVRQARIRRERREAKIKAGGSERLDKITKLSGRAPEHMSNNSPSRGSPSPSPMPAEPTPPLRTTSDDVSQVRAQEDFLRSMLRAHGSEQGQNADQQPQQMPEDPIMKLLSSISGAEGGPNANNPGGPSISPESIQQALGMPGWASGLLAGGGRTTPPVEAEAKAATTWNLVHIVFSVLAGMYFLFLLESATAEFGQDPPPPATIRDPFLLFVLGELLMLGSRILLGASSNVNSLRGLYGILKDVCRDGSVVLFMLGAASWWKGSAR